MNFEDFNKAISEKNEIELYKSGRRIALKYCYRYSTMTKKNYDYEFAADEIIIKLLKVAKKTDFSKPYEYYFGVIKQGAKFQYLDFIAKEKAISLDETLTSKHGDNLTDRMELNHCIQERTAVEKLKTDLVNEIILLADEYKTKHQVWEILKKKYPGIDRAYFSYVCREFKVQFYNEKDFDLFMEIIKIYSVYKQNDKDVEKTRIYFKQHGRDLRRRIIKQNAEMAEWYLDMFHNHKKTFMARFILPPNSTKEIDKWHYKE